MLWFCSLATILATSTGVLRAVLYNIQNYFDKNSSDSYARHSFVSAPLERLTVNANIRHPFKWFFSYYFNTTSEREKTTQKAFSKLSIVTEVPRKETERFKSFEEELKTKSSGYPWFSKVYQGCLFLDGQCVFDRSTTKVGTVFVHTPVK